MLTDTTARRYVSAMTLQYAVGQAASMHSSYPDVPIIESETVCNAGANSWSDAMNLYSQMKQYMDGGAESYFMWNMVLNETGKSSWNWAQNAMVTVNQTTGAVTYNGEYYVMRHFSQFIEPGAHEVACSGYWDDKIAFVNPDDSVVVVVRNSSSSDTPVLLDLNNGASAQELSVTLPASSVSTFVIPVPEPSTIALAVGFLMGTALFLRRKACHRG